MFAVHIGNKAYKFCCVKCVGEYTYFISPMNAFSRALWLAFALSLQGLRAETMSFDFNAGFQGWKPLSTGGWEHRNDAGAGGGYLALIEAGTLRPPVRRPTAYVLLPEHVWSDFTLDLRARSDEAATVGNRDVVVLFGYIDDTHYYYAHLSSHSDDAFHNVIFRVEGSERSLIDEQTLPAARLDGTWQQIRVTHASDGAIAVYLDDLETPLMTAQDTTYPAGAIGFGAFDDRASFDDVRIEGTLLTPTTIEPRLELLATPPGLRFDQQAGFNYTVQRLRGRDGWDRLADLPVPPTGAGSSQTAFPLPEISEGLYRLLIRGPVVGEP